MIWVLSLAAEILSYAMSVGRERYTGRPCTGVISRKKDASADEWFMTYENEAVGQHTVDLCGGVVFSNEVGLGNGELFGGFLVRVKPVIYDQRDERGSVVAN